MKRHKKCGLERPCLESSSVYTEISRCEHLQSQLVDFKDGSIYKVYWCANGSIVESAKEVKLMCRIEAAER